MILLSIHVGNHDSCAVVSKDYQVLATIQQERVTRIKGDGGSIPLAAIHECLNVANVKLAMVDILVMDHAKLPAHFFRHSKRSINFKYFLYRILRIRRLKSYSDLLRNAGKAISHDIIKVEKILSLIGLRKGTPIHFYNHHAAHASAAIFYSNHCNSTLAYTADGGGDNIFYSARYVNDKNIYEIFGGSNSILEEEKINSIGLAYGFCTDALGYKMNRHEGKLTGLAAFGRPLLANEYSSKFQILEDGQVRSTFTSYHEMRQYFLDSIKNHSPADIAASIQKTLESTILSSLSNLCKKFKPKYLALAGGVFANVRLNKYISDNLDINEIFIFPGMGDEGLALGGLLTYLKDRDGEAAWFSQQQRLSNVYLGGNYSKDLDRLCTSRNDIKVSTTSIFQKAAKMLASGKVGAVYSARMEFGPRALGARSIVASPENSGINQSLNDRLNRTEFMPFAPYVHENDADEVFEITEKNRYACRFMTITTKVKDKWKNKIPAVTHIDGTARPQIIDDDLNSVYAGVLREFKRLTTIPVLVNTSFNAHEEPIINTPNEAISALIMKRIDS